MKNHLNHWFGFIILHIVFSIISHFHSDICPYKVRNKSQLFKASVNNKGVFSLML